VNVRPRWAEPLLLSLKFHNGTMVEGEAFSPQSAKIRGFVMEQQKKTGHSVIPRAEIETFLGGTKDASKKAIQRAKDDGAIGEIEAGATKGSFYLPVETDEVFV
jgi:hypothetical protein